MNRKCIGILSALLVGSATLFTGCNAPDGSISSFSVCAKVMNCSGLNSNSGTMNFLATTTRSGSSETIEQKATLSGSAPSCITMDLTFDKFDAIPSTAWAEYQAQVGFCHAPIPPDHCYQNDPKTGLPFDVCVTPRHSQFYVCGDVTPSCLSHYDCYNIPKESELKFEALTYTPTGADGKSITLSNGSQVVNASVQKIDFGSGSVNVTFDCNNPNPGLDAKTQAAQHYLLWKLKGSHQGISPEAVSSDGSKDIRQDSAPLLEEKKENISAKAAI